MYSHRHWKHDTRIPGAPNIGYRPGSYRRICDESWDRKSTRKIDTSSPLGGIAGLFRNQVNPGRPMASKQGMQISVLIRPYYGSEWWSCCIFGYRFRPHTHQSITQVRKTAPLQVVISTIRQAILSPPDNVHFLPQSNCVRVLAVIVHIFNPPLLAKGMILGFPLPAFAATKNNESNDSQKRPQWIKCSLHLSKAASAKWQNIMPLPH